MRQVFHDKSGSWEGSEKRFGRRGFGEGILRGGAYIELRNKNKLQLPRYSTGKVKSRKGRGGASLLSPSRPLCRNSFILGGRALYFHFIGKGVEGQGKREGGS